MPLGALDVWVRIAMSLKQRIQELADRLAIPLDARGRDALATWIEAARMWNQKLDLTAASGDAALVEVLALDALVMSARAAIEPGTRIVDIGTGAGTPGLGLALLREDLGPVLLVEPLAKRAAFLRTVIGSLRLESRIRVVTQKIDPELPVLSPESASFLGDPDLAISRATFPPPIWAAVGLRLAPQCILMLVDDAPPLPEGAQVVLDARYALLSSGAPRRLMRIART